MKAGFKYLVNPLAGCNRAVLKKLEACFSVDPAFRAKYIRSKLLNRVLSELSRFDRIRFRSMREGASLDIPKIFIIGHWRSGTSFLHNLLCRVYPAAYTTTYQAIFPNNLFAFRGLIKFFMRVFLPRERPTDAMKMHPDYPQEEELAIGHEKFFSFYYWFYFPRQANFIANEFLYLEDPESKRSKQFSRYYRDFMLRCCLNTHGEVFISKNPANTARIAVLTRLFPQARFIYLKRDPYETVQSSLIFFRSLLKGISLQEYEEQEVDAFIMENYKRLVQAYHESKELIPPGHLVELSYEELIKHPSKVLSDLIHQLDLGVQADLSKAGDYLADSSDFPTHKYRFSNKLLRAVNEQAGDLIVKQGYRVRKPHAHESLTG
jgi:hypothetical protein